MDGWFGYFDGAINGDLEGSPNALAGGEALYDGDQDRLIVGNTVVQKSESYTEFSRDLYMSSSNGKKTNIFHDGLVEVISFLHVYG